MFERSYQSQIIREDLQQSKKHPKVMLNMGLLQTLTIQITNYFKLFLETSSIHGLNHLVAYGRHPFEM